MCFQDTSLSGFHFPNASTKGLWASHPSGTLSPSSDDELMGRDDYGKNLSKTASETHVPHTPARRTLNMTRQGCGAHHPLSFAWCCEFWVD